MLYWVQMRLGFYLLLTFIFVGLLVAPSTLAHPGRTAADGCHYCRTNCSYWGEVYGARHCHGGGVGSGGSVELQRLFDQILATPTLRPRPRLTPTIRPRPTKPPAPVPTISRQAVEIVPEGSTAATDKSLLGVVFLWLRRVFLGE